MNKIVNKFLLDGDRFMPEMHLRQRGFTRSACGAFAKHPKWIKKLKATGDVSYTYSNKLDIVYQLGGINLNSQRDAF